MRINVYSQELTKEVVMVSKTATDTGIIYYGIRLFLHSPDLLHHTVEDDDRSAITFWVPHANSFTPADLAEVFRKMANEAERAEGIVQRNAMDEPSVKEDPINPSYYKQGDIECIEAIRATLTEEEFRGFCKGNAIKYTWRERHKRGAEDLEKAKWYLNKLIKQEESDAKG